MSKKVIIVNVTGYQRPGGKVAVYALDWHKEFASDIPLMVVSKSRFKKAPSPKRVRVFMDDEVIRRVEFIHSHG